MRSHLVLFCVFAAAALMAQTQAAFEVASVKPNKSGTTQANVGMPPNGVNFVNLPLRGIIQLAYGINQPSKLAASRIGQLPSDTISLLERQDQSPRTNVV
jgi:hypothetical protein